jgi:fucose permease
VTAIPVRLAASRLHYGWVIAAVTFTVVLLTAGVRAAPGVLIVPFEAEFHWSRATISLAVGINLLLYGLVGPFAAALMDRFGVRWTMTASLAATAIGVAVTPAMSDPGSSFCFGASWSGSAPALSAPISRPLSRRAGS